MNVNASVDTAEHGCGCGHLKILTTQPKGDHPEWLKRVDVLPGWLDSVDETWKQPWKRSLIGDFRWAWHLFRFSRKFDVVLTGSERPALVFALLQMLLRRRKIPHIFIQCMWDLPAAPFWKRLLKRHLLHAVASSASRVLVMSRHHVQAYSQVLGLPAEKFVFIPYHSSLYDAPFISKEGDYIFTGGDSNRDYPTLIEAVRDLPHRLVIAASFRHHFKGIKIPKNVEIVTVDKQEFIRLGAEAAVNVVPMQKGFIHSGGQQTFIDFMTMGKPLVVADECGAADYITDGVTGLLVKPGEVSEMRNALIRLMDDSEYARRLGRNAKEAAKQFTPENFFTGVFAIVADCLTAD